MDLNRTSADAFDRALGEGEELRALDWGALLARLGAERDLRRELANGLSMPRRVADFLGGAALAVPDVVARPASGSSRDAPSVNPDALADLKSTGGNTLAAGRKTPGARLGARGKQ